MIDPYLVICHEWQGQFWECLQIGKTLLKEQETIYRKNESVQSVPAKYLFGSCWPAC